MTIGRLWEFLQLRYRLQWAYARRSPGHIALFGLLLLALVIISVMSTFGSFVLTAAASRDGTAAAVLERLFGGLFGNALFVAILLRGGTRHAFSEPVLRQFPLSRLMRIVVRRGLGVFEPLWLLTGLTYGACAAGMWLWGGSHPLIVFPAAVLLVGANYGLAVLILALLERMLSTASGAALAAAAFNAGILILVGTQLATGVALDLLARLAVVTPPAVAAAAMGDTLWGPWALALLAVWVLLPCAGLLVIESKTVTGRTAPVARPGADAPGLLAPGTPAPLLVRSLLCQLRRPRTRVALAASLPMALFMIHGPFTNAGEHPLAAFERALLFIPLAGVLPLAMQSINTFGAEGAGFRRLLLTPVALGPVLRAAACAPLLVGFAYHSLFAVGWLLLAGVPVDARGTAMLLAQGYLVGLVFQSMALWSSVLSPRRVEYAEMFRDESTPGGYLVLGGAVVLLVVVPSVIRAWMLPGSILDSWWLPVIGLPFAYLAFELSLGAASGTLVWRRERVLAALEGRG